MQTFLPYPDFKRSAQVLDRQRLGKQRIEAWQIYRSLTANEWQGWKHHPAVRMWAGYETALLRYGLAIIKEWKRRGYKDSMEERFLPMVKGKRMKLPPWFGNEEFHASHRANLIRKDPVYYGQFGWKEKPMQGYVWPKIEKIIEKK